MTVRCTAPPHRPRPAEASSPRTPRIPRANASPALSTNVSLTPRLPISTVDEDDGYFNLTNVVRRKLMRKMKNARTRAWFCGHYHRNAGGFDEDLEVVVTSAVGAVLPPSGKDPLGLGGFKPPVVGPEHSGGLSRFAAICTQFDPRRS